MQGSTFGPIYVFFTCYTCKHAYFIIIINDSFCDFLFHVIIANNVRVLQLLRCARSIKPF